MAAIYKVTKSGEVHIYRNRTPRRDGGEPVLGWTIAAALFFCLRGFPFLLSLLAALLVEGASDALAAFIRDNLYAVLFDVWVLALLGWYIFSRFQKLVFSPATGQIYSGFLFSVIYPDNPWWLNYGIEAAIFVWYMRQMSYQSVRVSFDTKHRMIEYTTGFGLVKQACSFDMLRRFSIKRKNGFRTLCMVIEGQVVDPSIANSLSDAKMRSALEEVCEITGMDPDTSLAA